MMQGFLTIGSGLVRRAAEGAGDGTNVKLSPFAFLVFFVEILVFLPLLLYFGYTLCTVYPILAIVEDPSPPGYEPVSLSEDAEYVVHENAEPATERAAGGTQLITSSVRSIDQLLRSVGGWRANFRGFWAHFAYSFLFGAVTFVIGWFVPTFLGTLLASLILVQFSAVSVHTVIGAPTEIPFWRRLTPLRKTFEATCFPTLGFWLAMVASQEITHVLTEVMFDVNISRGVVRLPNGAPDVDAHLAWKIPMVLLISTLLQALLMIPAEVVLVRVQASLLPPDTDTIIPFDRSFQGKVEPAVVDGKGFVTMKDALATFPRSSWIRLFVLYAKVWLIQLGVLALFFAILVPEYAVFSRKSQQDDL